MTTRRTKITSVSKNGDKLVAKIQGVAGEEFEGEVYQPYGLSSSKSGGQTVTMEQEGDPDIHMTLPCGGELIAEEGTTVIYYENTKIILSEGGIVIEGSGKITTDMDIVSGGISLQNHTHPGVRSGPSSTGKPQ